MQNKPFDVLAVGELNIDLILNDIKGLPVIGKEINAEAMKLTLGSSTAIFAANLSVLGLKVGFLGKIGSDMFGELVQRCLAEKDIDTSLVMVEAQTSTGVTVVLNYDEDRAMVTYPGAMECLTINDIDDESLLKARHLHFSSLFLQPGIKNDITTLFGRAKTLGLTTSMDAQWDPTEKWEFDYKKILPLVDVFLPNEAELLNISKTGDLQNAIKKISSYVNNIVVKRGSKGSVLYSSGKGIIEKPAYINTEIADAIGAGDSFNAGFIFKFIKGESLDNCLDFGNLIGALNTTAAGGTGAFISREHIVKTMKTKFGVSVKL